MHLSDRQWKSLFRDIENNRCILLLGPRFWAKQELGHGRPLLEMLAEHLSTELEAEGVGFEKRAVHNLPYIAQRFLSIPKIRRIDLEDEATSFFFRHSKDVPEAYRALARIPFHLIVNTAPDDLIFRALQAEGRPAANFFYYNFKIDKGVNVPPISVQNPLVFNLFGSISDPESLVLTEENQVEFIKNVVRGNPPIPYQIMSQFDNRKTYLFLGFDLENWHYRLLLDSLKLENENTTIFPQMEDCPLTEITKSFYEDRYHFIFVDKKTTDFVLDLHEGFAAAVPETPAGTPLRNIVLLFDENETDTDFVQRLSAQLANLQHSGLANIWHKGMLQPGDPIDMVAAKMESADLILPVLSADFFASEAINRTDLPALMSSHFEKNTRILPVLFRDCDVDNSALRRFALLPRNGMPIRRWEDQDEALQHIVGQLQLLLHE
jgi:hypothetical protein